MEKVLSPGPKNVMLQYYDGLGMFEGEISHVFVSITTLLNTRRAIN
jgi:hypothetical protein